MQIRHFLFQALIERFDKEGNQKVNAVSDGKIHSFSARSGVI